MNKNNRIHPLRDYRKFLRIKLQQASIDTGISTAWLSKFERGVITRIKNVTKQKTLDKYIGQLKKRAGIKMVNDNN